MDLLICDTSVQHPGLVQVEGAGVSGWCRWSGDFEVGATVVVELEIPDEIEWSEIDIGDQRTAPQSLPIGMMDLRAQISDVDESGTVTLVLPEGSVLLVETTGDVPLHVVTEVVRMRVRHVTAYPTGY